MRGPPQYSSQQVTQALLQLVANDGDCKLTAEQLVADDFQVPESELRAWKNSAHKEQYGRLEREYADELERQLIALARTKALRVTGLENQVLDKIEAALDDGKLDPRDLPATLRSLTDTRVKTIDRVLTMTGRPSNPRPFATRDVAELVKGMATRGLIALAPGVELLPADADDQRGG